MWRPVFLLCLLQIFFTTALSSQPADTVIHPYESVRKTVETTIRERQDSIERQRLLQNIREHGKSLDELLAERQEQEKKEELRQWVRIGAGAILLFGLFFAIARRAGPQKR